ncbi:MAG TPA: peptidoglycan-binding domain-containing protein [Bryobacteraceae bacterium]|jgi:peptidoglycan hydrolase-like protein with peptidoglycan-binding domain|nr:peptidoglycan-binding domain-containing protein [Bryobacteraceae bacterium]
MNAARWVSAAGVLALAAMQLVAAASSGKQAVKTTAKKTKTTSVHGKQTARSRYSHRSRAHAKPAPSYQLHPDAERYQEIQKALADRGYFKGDVNGVWGDDSTDALKRFQADRKLPEDGKISALTLIGLGLGPKHDGKLVTPPGASAASNIADPPPLPEAPETQPPPR